MQLHFQVITLIGSNQGNYFENATACSKRTLKTIVTTQLYVLLCAPKINLNQLTRSLMTLTREGNPIKDI